MSREEVVITFPDGKKKSYVQGISLEEIAESISPSLKKKSVAGKVNGSLCDMSYSIHEDSEIELYDLNSSVGVEVMRHTTAHVLAQAVKRVFRDVHLGTGPVIENGFYYDFDLKNTLTHHELKKIEKEMNKIVSENLEIQRVEISREEAKKIFADDPLKLELLEDIPLDDVVTVYRQGEFVDLCRGPHLPSTRFIKAFKLTHVSGVYWRGDKNNKMIQRMV